MFLGRTRRLAWTLAVSWIAIAGRAQAPTSSSFEVASVRPSPRGHGYTSVSPPGSTQFNAKNASMKLLLGMAFGVSSNQISATMGWIDDQYYDVEAKPEGDSGLSYEQLQAPLRQLLVQRFQLAFHRESKEVSGYAMVVGKNGSRLEKGKDGPATGYILPDGLRGSAMSMRSLAAMLAISVGRPVVDRTGIAGNYDVDLKFAPNGATDSQLPSIFTALQEQFGLKLEPQKVSLEVVVIDHLEKTPSEN